MSYWKHLSKSSNHPRRWSKTGHGGSQGMGEGQGHSEGKSLGMGGNLHLDFAGLCLATPYLGVSSSYVSNWKSRGPPGPDFKLGAPLQNIASCTSGNLLYPMGRRWLHSANSINCTYFQYDRMGEWEEQSSRVRTKEKLLLTIKPPTLHWCQPRL